MLRKRARSGSSAPHSSPSGRIVPLQLRDAGNLPKQETQFSPVLLDTVRSIEEADNLQNRHPVLHEQQNFPCLVHNQAQVPIIAR